MTFNMVDKYKNTIQTWKRVAQIYEEKFMDLDLYDATYTLFCSEIKNPKGSILEIGCGPGNITRQLRSQLPEASILATDVASEMIEAAKNNVDNVRFKVLDARDINSLDEKFDAVISGFCVLYLDKSDLNSLIQNSAALLNDQGIIYLSFIEGDYSDSEVQTRSNGDSMKVHYYQESDVFSFFEDHSIKPIQTIRVSYPLADDSEQIHLILLGRKN